MPKFAVGHGIYTTHKQKSSHHLVLVGRAHLSISNDIDKVRQFLQRPRSQKFGALSHTTNVSCGTSHAARFFVPNITYTSPIYGCAVTVVYAARNEIRKSYMRTFPSISCCKLLRVARSTHHAWVRRFIICRASSFVNGATRRHLYLLGAPVNHCGVYVHSCGHRILKLQAKMQAELLW